MRRLGRMLTAAAVAAVPIVIAAGPAHAADADIRVTEVNPRASDTPLGDDWVELTNFGTSPVDVTGWRVDDDSNNFAAAGPINGVTSIAPGESVILITEAVQSEVATYLNQWFGANPPAGLQVGWLSGSGLGLSSGGDQLHVFNAAGTSVADVSYPSTAGAAPFATLDNSDGVNGAISARSQVGVNGAFVSFQGSEIGSPGKSNATTLPPPVVPEFPAAALGVATGGAVLGGWALLRRRNAVRATA